MDPFEAMATLSRELDGVKAEEDRLARRRAEIYGQMKTVAAAMATANIPSPSAERQIPMRSRQAVRTEEAAPLAVTITGRPGELLALLKEKPGAPYGWLAEKMYGEDTKTTKANIASLVNKAAKAGLLKQEKPGSYVLTEAAAE